MYYNNNWEANVCSSTIIGKLVVSYIQSGICAVKFCFWKNDLQGSKLDNNVGIKKGIIMCT